MDCWTNSERTDFDFEVIGIDSDGGLICKEHNGETYNCGETLEEFGIDNLTEKEKLNLKL